MLARTEGVVKPLQKHKLN